MRFTKGNHAFIVATHTDKAHIHNHIIFNSTSLDCTHKFRDFFLLVLLCRDAIDQILREGGAKDFNELLYKLEDAGYKIKRGKHISLKGKNQKRFIRLRSLGDGYSEDDLKKILAGEMEHAFYDNEKPKIRQRLTSEKGRS